MRFFTAVAAFGLLTVASAQSSANATEVTSTSAAAPAATSESAAQRCLDACGASDICCKARCVNVPCPNEVAVNQTTDCAAQCPQGNGTEEETSSYAACQSSCISSLFFPLSTAAGGASATGSGAGASTTGAFSFGSATGTGIGGSAASATGAAASATGSSDSGNGAGRNTIAGAGLLGLVIAGLAL